MWQREHIERVSNQDKGRVRRRQKTTQKKVKIENHIEINQKMREMARNRDMSKQGRGYLTFI